MAILVANLKDKSFFFHIVLASEDTHTRSAAVTFKSQTVVFIQHSLFFSEKTSVKLYTHALSLETEEKNLGEAGDDTRKA